MSKKVFKKIYIDPNHTLHVTINDAGRTVIAELETPYSIEFIYAEQFDEPCDYLKIAIKRSLEYIDNCNFGNEAEKKTVFNKNPKIF